MSIDPNVRGTQAAQGQTSHGADPARTGATGGSAGGGAAFRALLERLERSADAIDEATSELEDPRQLGAVVEKSRVSVEEALTLGGDLLEAFRAAQQRAAGGSASTEAPPDDAPHRP